MLQRRIMASGALCKSRSTCPQFINIVSAENTEIEIIDVTHQEKCTGCFRRSLILDGPSRLLESQSVERYGRTRDIHHEECDKDSLTQ